MAQGKRGTSGSNLSQRQLEDAAKVIRLGMTVRDACAFAGISHTAFYKSVRIGKTRPLGDSLRDFADAVAKGKTDAKVFAVGQVHAGMRKDWKAAAWLLGVSYPKEFGPKVKVTLETEFAGALERLKAALPPEMYEKALDALAAGDGEEGEGEDSPGETRLP